MHITPDLTPAAMSRWLRMSPESKEIILSNIWCMPVTRCMAFAMLWVIFIHRATSFFMGIAFVVAEKFAA